MDEKTKERMYKEAQPAFDKLVDDFLYNNRFNVPHWFDEDEIQSVLNEAVLRFMDKYDTSMGNWPGFVYRSGKNALIDHLRSYRRFNRKGLIPYEKISYFDAYEEGKTNKNAVNPDSIVDDREDVIQKILDQDELAEVLGHITAPRVLIYLALKGQGYKAAEIGQIMGATPHGLKQTAQVYLQKFRKKYKRSYFTIDGIK